MTQPDLAQPTPVVPETTVVVEPPAEPAPKPDTGDDVAKWKAMARKHEEEAKANKAAAAELQQIKDAQKTESERAAEALTAAEKRANAAEATALRMRVALEHGVEADDMDLLGEGDEDTLKARAERITSRYATAPVPAGRRPVENLRPGATPTGQPEDGSEFDHLFSR